MWSVDVECWCGVLVWSVGVECGVWSVGVECGCVTVLK